MLLLRALNPQTEQELFHTAFDWRKSPRRDRVAFEVFAADDPNQIVMGLFNEADFLAVYVFYQISPDTFDCHFTSRRDAPKDAVLAAGRQLVSFFNANNLHLSTHIAARNGPLRRWAEAVGLVVSQKNTSGQAACYSDTVSATSKLLLEFRSAGEPP
jgi:hypothetical protein